MAQDITRWQWPDRSPKGELTSLSFQAARVKLVDPPNPEQVEQVTRKMLKMYPNAGPPWAFFNGSLSEIGFNIAYETVLQDVQRDASPGMPFVALHCATNASVLGKFPDVLKRAVFDRLMLLSMVQVTEEDPMELVLSMLCDPVRVFVKNEPHLPEKVAQGRFRLICSVSLIDQLCERILYSRQNAIEIASWTEIPSKPGMGLDDASLQFLHRKWSTYANPHEADISGWDFSMQAWEMEWEADFRARLCGLVGTPYHRAMRNRVHCEARTLFMLSDGRLFKQMRAGKRCSGSYNTSSGNSRCRVFVGLLKGAKDVFAMGDDSVEDDDAPVEQSITRYDGYGHKVKSYAASKPGEFEFCSTRIYEQDGVVKGEPLNWSRVTFRLLYATGDWEGRWSQFERDMRWHPDREFMKTIRRLFELNINDVHLQSGSISAWGAAQMPGTKKKQVKIAKKKKKSKRKQKASVPVAMSMTLRKQNPEIKSNGKVVTISHREFLEVVTADNEGKIVNFAYNINAGLIDSFPWLGGIASNFQRYEFSKLIWEYTPSCASITPGNLVMATIPDTHDALMSSYEQFLAADGSSQVNVWQDLKHNSLAVAAVSRRGLTRTLVAVPPGADQNLYDAGVFQLHVDGATPNLTIGRLSVSYTVKLYTPVIGATTDSALFYGQANDQTPVGEWANLYGRLQTGLVGEVYKYGTKIAEKFNSNSIRFLRPGVYQVFMNMFNPVSGTFTSPGVLPILLGESLVPSTLLNWSWAGAPTGSLGAGAFLMQWLVTIGAAGAILTWQPGQADSVFGSWKIQIDTLSAIPYISPGYLLAAQPGPLPIDKATKFAMSLSQDPAVVAAVVAKLAGGSALADAAPVEEKG